jgi:hypothetical protein
MLCFVFVLFRGQRVRSRLHLRFRPHRVSLNALLPPLCTSDRSSSIFIFILIQSLYLYFVMRFVLELQIVVIVSISSQILIWYYILYLL